MRDNTLEALESGQLTLGELQRCVMNICRFLLNAPVMERFGNGEEEEPERIPALPDSEGTGTGTREVSGSAARAESIRFCAPSDIPQSFRMPDPGIRHVRVCMKYDNKDARAQSACNLLLNGVRFATPQISGTGGRSVIRDQGDVLLEAGRYELTLQETKMPGMTVEWVEFVPADDPAR